MRIASLEYVNNLIKSTGVPYRYVRWQTTVPDDYYFVGEYFEAPSTTLEESGGQEATFILRGYTRQDWLLLEQAKEKIEKACAKTAILSDGTGIAVSYDSATIVPTADAQVKSIKINLTIHEWKVK
jgi:hypothetical protein